MAEYLLEIRSQEMPPRALRSALKQLGGRLFEEMMGCGLGPDEIMTGATPRRLMVCLTGLASLEPDREEQELGPPVAEAYDDGEPTEALAGFKERVGSAADKLIEVNTERGAYVAVTLQRKGRSVGEVLTARVPQLLSEIIWESTLRWRPDRSWIRPVEGIVSLLDGKVLPFEFDGSTAGNSTIGHPILSPRSMRVRNFKDYRTKLGKLGIEVGWEARLSCLHQRLERATEELQGELLLDEGLLDRLTALCEIPGVVSGSFDHTFLTLPEEVLLETLKEQQNAFAVRQGEELLPVFLTVMDRPDDPQQVVQAGQEASVAGSLNDASFFYEADRRFALAERGRLLQGVTFHPRLGNYEEKTKRICSLVELLAKELGWQDDLAAALQAAALAKADLTTDMVARFPRLKGTMGSLYARTEGYVENVWQAIGEQYQPWSQDASIPQHRAGLLLALADRLDTLVGFAGIGSLPRGGKDPLGQRRLAQGLLRILVEAEMELDLDLVAARSVLLYGEVLERGAEEILGELQGFLHDRTRHLLGIRGFAHDEIEAAMAVWKKSLPDLLARIQALREVREEPEFRSLVLAAKRLANIIRDAPEHKLASEELQQGAEQDLHGQWLKTREQVLISVDERRYADGLRAMAQLVPALDRFFAEVLVMDENEHLRANRIALLQACRRLFWRVARLKQMAVEKAD